MSPQRRVLKDVSYVAQSDTMLELATCWGVRCRSALIVCVNCRMKSQKMPHGMDKTFNNFHLPKEETCTMPRMRS